MHTVHHPINDKTNSGIIAAALGIMLSVSDYTAKLSWAEQRVIDNFFESLKWDDKSYPQKNTGTTID